MTGKQVMQWILMNDLYDVVIADDSFIQACFMDETEAAAKYEVGTATIRAWYQTGVLKGLKLGETILYYKEQENPIVN